MSGKKGHKKRTRERERERDASPDAHPSVSIVESIVAPVVVVIVASISHGSSLLGTRAKHTGVSIDGLRRVDERASFGAFKGRTAR